MSATLGWFALCAGGLVGLLFALAFALCLRASCVAPVGLALRWHPRYDLPLHALPLCAYLFAGIRVMPSCFKRRPCAGRHLLFFAAAKKSRQKKAAHTANPCVCLRAPNRSLTSRGNFSIQVRCQRSSGAPHPLHAPAFQHALPGSPSPPRWQTVCRPKCSTRLTSDR